MAIERIVIEVKRDVMQTTKEVAQLENQLRKLSHQVRSLSQTTAKLNVSTDLNQLKAQLITMAGAISGMSVISAAIGSLDQNQLTTGLVQVDQMCQRLMITAAALEHIQQQASGDFGSLQLKFGAMAEALIGMSAIAYAVGSLPAQTLIQGLLQVDDITERLVSLAKGLEEIDQRVSGDLGGFQSKFLAMAEALIGMGAIAYAAGSVSFETLSTGLSQIDEVRARLVSVALALEEIDNRVSGDLGGFQSKFLAMAEALIGMGAIAYAAGSVSFETLSTGLSQIDEVRERLVSVALAL